MFGFRFFFFWGGFLGVRKGLKGLVGVKAKTQSIRFGFVVSKLSYG